MKKILSNANTMLYVSLVAIIISDLLSLVNIIFFPETILLLLSILTWGIAAYNARTIRDAENSKLAALTQLLTYLSVLLLLANLVYTPVAYFILRG